MSAPAKPVLARPYEFSNLPTELKKLRQFVMWRWKWTPRDGRWTKAPHQINGNYASSTNPATWCTFPQALAAYDTGKFDGIGFVFTEGDGLVFIDFDHVIKDGKIAPHVERWRKHLHSYTELSVSGEGLHVYGLGALPGGKGRHKGEVELYDRGRFAVVTGWYVPGAAIHVNEVNAGLELLLSEHFLDREAAEVVDLPAQGLGHTDEEVGRLCATHVATRFRQLFYEGPGKLNPSDADFSLACMLAFYCGNDFAQIERIFGESELAERSKWRKRADYRKTTIINAIAALNGKFYTEAEPFPPLPEKDQLLESLESSTTLVRYGNADVEVAGQYDLTIVGVTVRCDGLQLRDWRWLSAQIGFQGGTPPPLKPEMWTRVLNSLYASAEVRELPPEATERGKLRLILHTWLRRAQNLHREPTVADYRDLSSYLPVKVVINETECVVFKWASFHRYLKNERYDFPRGGNPVFNRMLMDVGADVVDEFEIAEGVAPISIWVVPVADLMPEDPDVPYVPESPC